MNDISTRLGPPIFLAVLVLLAPWTVLADDDMKNGGNGNDDEPPPTIAEKVKDMEKRVGFFTFYADAMRGKIWLELPPPQGDDGEVAEMIYMSGLAQGLGSNPVGLDRGQIRGSVLVRIRRLGPRVLFEQPNLGYRALSQNPDERQATQESFATSVIWGEKIGALDPDGRALVDLTSFLVRDSADIRATLRDTEQGDYQLDPDRSAIDLEACLAFPDNIELEAVLTFAGEEPGDHLNATVPSPQAVSLLHHHSLVRLPEEGYQPRRLDPRIGVFGVSFLDYAVALEEEMRTQWVARHRLEKTDPTAARSTVKEPIVYYVDRGAPEPIRSALLDGARWWTESFEAAGFIDGYRVEVLPEGAHPLDVRYNVIQWVHRSTRGWSYGNAISDPRTGEIIKGHVSLGSLRVRQDRRIFEGLLGTSKTGSGAPDDPIEVALARIRQLSAHEVGHTLGLTHNFAASTYDGRASVMDYPAPLVDVTSGGELDVSRAYGVGIGTWDTACIRYAYSQFAPGADEDAELERIVAETIAHHTFVTDTDARPPSASDWRGNLWDNGVDPVAEFAKALEVRRIALERFGEENLPAGRPVAELEEVLAPLYFHHRYQLDAIAKVLGGMEYDYTLRGDGQTATSIVDGERQRAALRGMLAALEPDVLDVPESVLRLLPPRPFAMPPNRELFASTSWPAFDALGAAATAADDVVEAVLEPFRLARLVDFHRRDSNLPSVGEVLEALVAQAFTAVDGEGARATALRRVVQRVLVDRMLAKASDPALRGDLRAELEWTLRVDLGAKLAMLSSSGDRQTAAHAAGLAMDVQRFLERPGAAPEGVPLPSNPPPGSPIGSDFRMGCGFEAYLQR